jgi:anti-sigma factor RsiW
MEAMRCDEIQERFVELLYDETGTPPASPELRAHVDSCPRCRAELEDLQATRRMLALWKDEPAPASKVARLLRTRRTVERRLPPAVRWGGIAAALLLGFLALANAEITVNRDGFSFRTHLFSRQPDIRDLYTKAETRDLLRRALDDTESRLSEETVLASQRVLDTIEQERQMEIRFINARLGRARSNN